MKNLLIEDIDCAEFAPINTRAKEIYADEYDATIKEKFCYSCLTSEARRAKYTLANNNKGFFDPIDFGKKHRIKYRQSFYVCKSNTRTALKSKDKNTLEKEKELYEANKGKYLIEYEGKYIALKNGTVLDFDTDFSKLSQRVYSKNGFSPVFIPFITRKKKFSISSPKHINQE